MFQSLAHLEQLSFPVLAISDHLMNDAICVMRFDHLYGVLASLGKLVRHLVTQDERFKNGPRQTEH